MRNLVLVGWLATSWLAITGGAAQADDGEHGREEPEGSRAGSGIRVGASLNGDQAVAGAHVMFASIGDVAFGSSALVGINSQWMTLRGSALARWDFLQLGHFTFYSTVGGSALHYFPIGRLAGFCRATGLSCSGADAGLELGGGIELDRVGVEATAGFGGMPAVTLVATYQVLR
jgi:hypothetical protein